MRSLCNECGRFDCHPNCPEAGDIPEPTFTVWQLGKVPDTIIRSESEMRQAASKLGFDADIVVSQGEADIVEPDTLIVMGGCYLNEGDWIYE
jgi:hypothetical protein|tara:strand:+ start:4246 stop:4521 length:276 start_codon:yes stop_codon:yes gene_type:complete